MTAMETDKTKKNGIVHKFEYDEEEAAMAVATQPSKKKSSKKKKKKKKETSLRSSSSETNLQRSFQRRPPISNLRRSFQMNPPPHFTNPLTPRRSSSTFKSNGDETRSKKKKKSHKQKGTKSAKNSEPTSPRLHLESPKHPQQPSQKTTTTIKREKDTGEKTLLLQTKEDMTKEPLQSPTTTHAAPRRRRLVDYTKTRRGASDADRTSSSSALEEKSQTKKNLEGSDDDEQHFYQQIFLNLERSQQRSSSADGPQVTSSPRKTKKEPVPDMPLFRSLDRLPLRYSSRSLNDIPKSSDDTMDRLTTPNWSPGDIHYIDDRLPDNDDNEERVDFFLKVPKRNSNDEQELWNRSWQSLGLAGRAAMALKRRRSSASTNHSSSSNGDASCNNNTVAAKRKAFMEKRSLSATAILGNNYTSAPSTAGAMASRRPTLTRGNSKNSIVNKQINSVPSVYSTHRKRANSRGGGGYASADALWPLASSSTNDEPQQNAEWGPSTSWEKTHSRTLRETLSPSPSLNAIPAHSARSLYSMQSGRQLVSPGGITSCSGESSSNSTNTGSSIPSNPVMAKALRAKGILFKSSIMSQLAEGSDSKENDAQDNKATSALSAYLQQKGQQHRLQSRQRNRQLLFQKLQGDRPSLTPQDSNRVSCSSGTTSSSSDAYSSYNVPKTSSFVDTISQSEAAFLKQMEQELGQDGEQPHLGPSDTEVAQSVQPNRIGETRYVRRGTSIVPNNLRFVTTSLQLGLYNSGGARPLVPQGIEHSRPCGLDGITQSSMTSTPVSYPHNHTENRSGLSSGRLMSSEMLNRIKEELTPISSSGNESYSPHDSHASRTHSWTTTPSTTGFSHAMVVRESPASYQSEFSSSIDSSSLGSRRDREESPKVKLPPREGQRSSRKHASLRRGSWGEASQDPATREDHMVGCGHRLSSARRSLKHHRYSSVSPTTSEEGGVHSVMQTSNPELSRLSDGLLDEMRKYVLGEGDLGDDTKSTDCSSVGDSEKRSAKNLVVKSVASLSSMLRIGSKSSVGNR